MTLAVNNAIHHFANQLQEVAQTLHLSIRVLVAAAAEELEREIVADMVYAIDVSADEAKMMRRQLRDHVSDTSLLCAAIHPEASIAVWDSNGNSVLCQHVDEQEHRESAPQ